MNANLPVARFKNVSSAMRQPTLLKQQRDYPTSIARMINLHAAVIKIQHAYELYTNTTTVIAT